MHDIIEILYIVTLSSLEFIKIIFWKNKFSLIMLCQIRISEDSVKLIRLEELKE